MKQLKIVNITSTLLLTMLLVTGCMQAQPNTPTLKNTSDINLKVNKDGDVTLHKEHTYEDGSKSTDTESISKSSLKKDSLGYEVVPNFDKKYTKNLALKNKNLKKEKKIILKKGKVKISVEDIPLNEFINLVFSEVLKLNYTVSQEVSKINTPITLNMTNIQKKQDVFQVVKKLLSLNGVALKKENGIIFLSKKRKTTEEIPDTGIYIGYGRQVSKSIPDDETIMMFVPYENIPPKKSVYVLKLAGISGSTFYYPTSNIQMIKNTAGEIRRSLKVINLIDRPYMLGKTPYIIELKDIEVDQFTKRMKTIFKTNGIPVANTPSDAGILLTPIQELNSLFVISSKKSWIDMLLYWKGKLDITSKISMEPKFYTYKVKNRKADELATALNDVINIKLMTFNNNKKQNINTKKKKQQQSEHSIKFDLPTNTLMMKLLPSEYRELLPLIEKLDALPLQVLAEVTLAEVTLTDSFSLGFEYTLRNNAASQGVTLTDALLTATFGGTGFGASYNSKKLDATINALAENKELSILSKPKILILNNETGNINVGTQIPVVTSETSASDVGGTTPSINRNITYRNTGIIVGLTPTINSNGILTMKINLQLSEAQLNDTSGIDSPLIVNRTLTTSLTLKDGETVMLGGLISKNKSTSDTGVPYLMDLPWIGTLFKSKSNKVVKTELIMLIKPYIIKNTDQLSEKTRKYKSLLRLLDKYSLF